MQIVVNSWGRKIHMLINFLKGGKNASHTFCCCRQGRVPNQATFWHEFSHLLEAKLNRWQYGMLLDISSFSKTQENFLR